MVVLPQVLLLAGKPPVPNPIIESQVSQSSSLLQIQPILALALTSKLDIALKPSLLQLYSRDACEPISAFQIQIRFRFFIIMHYLQHL